MWLSHHQFKESFESWWTDCNVQGWEGFKFMKRLNFVKNKIKIWNKEVFGDLREAKDSIVKELVSWTTLRWVVS